jgi:hypothetical protein
MRSPAAVIALLVLSMAVAGCEMTSNWLHGRRPAEPVLVEANQSQADSYLTEMFELASGDPATQAEIFADARSAATLTPDPSTGLRYALVLATPGLAETDSAAAQSLFRDLLAETELLTPTEIALATIHLRDVEARLVMDAEARRLRSEMSLASSTEMAAVTQRIAAIEAENLQLSQSLAEALAKLDALSAIERSIREQAGNNGNQ